MKTEDFDQAVRDKLEGGFPLYREEDIERVQGYVNKKQKKNRGPLPLIYMSITVLGLGLAGMLVWNLSLQKTNNELRGRLIEGKEIEDKIPPARKRQAEVTDLTNIAEPPNAKSMAKATEISYKISTKTANTITAEKSIVAEKSISTGKSISVENSASVENSVSTVKSDSTENSFIFPQKDSSDLTAIGIPVNAVIQTDIKPLKDSTAPAESKSQSKFASALKGIRYSAGLDMGRASGGQKEAGLTAELLLNKNWGLNAGIKINFIDNDERYSNNQDYAEKKGRNFSSAYPDIATGASQVSNLHFKYSIFEIPLTLHYYIPMSNSYTFVVGLGTDLDVYGMQELDCDYQTNNYVAHANYSEKSSLKVVNNSTLQLGVQKQVKHFVFRASPFLNTQWYFTDYKTSNLYYGFDLKVLYIF